MSNAADLTSATRSALGMLVEREERRVGSRDVAYEIVASTVGSSTSWVKKFLNKSTEAKEPRITLFMNIRQAYDNVCNRVEQEHQNELVKIAKLRRDIDAVTTGFGEMVDGSMRAPASRETVAAVDEVERG